jgi:hypothetical protein
MRKADLIKLLESIDGNPEIKLWNGYASDYMDIDKELVPTYLSKMTFEFFLEMCRLEHCMDTGADRKTYTFTHDEIVELRRNYKEHYNWEYDQYVTDEDIAKKKYTKKNIVIINAKTRGVKTFDRIGALEY